MTDVPYCPRCEVKMKKGCISRSFGNPITIVEKVPTFLCPKCDFEVIPEDKYEEIRKKITQKSVKEIGSKAKLIIL